MSNSPNDLSRGGVTVQMVLPDADRAMLALTPFIVVARGAARVGDRTPQVGAFVPLGGAFAKSRNPQQHYGGADGGFAWALPAEYEAATGTVHALESPGARESRLAPWIDGQDITVWGVKTRNSRGIVLRCTRMGESGFDQHVYIEQPARTPGASPIILHHDTPNAPQNSTQAYEGDLSRNALLSDALRIGAGVNGLCGITGMSVATPDPGPDWVYFNATKHGGNRYSGYLATRWAASDAYMSYEAGGPLREASSLHNLAHTRDKRDLRRGALSIAQHLWTNGNPKFDAPMKIREEDEPPVVEPEGFPVRVYCMFNPREKHVHPCAPGHKPKMIEWHVRLPITDMPPCAASRPGDTPKIGPVTGGAYTKRTLFSAGVVILASPGA